MHYTTLVNSVKNLESNNSYVVLVLLYFFPHIMKKEQGCKSISCQVFFTSISISNVEDIEFSLVSLPYKFKSKNDLQSPNTTEHLKYTEVRGTSMSFLYHLHRQLQYLNDFYMKAHSFKILNKS